MGGHGGVCLVGNSTVIHEGERYRGLGILREVVGRVVASGSSIPPMKSKPPRKTFWPIR